MHFFTLVGEGGRYSRDLNNLVPPARFAVDVIEAFWRRKLGSRDPLLRVHRHDDFYIFVDVYIYLRVQSILDKRFSLDVTALDYGTNLGLEWWGGLPSRYLEE